MLSKGDLQEGATYYAQGGIAAVLDDSDSIDSHVEDTLRAGVGLCHRDVVEHVVERSASAVSWLLAQGVDVRFGHRVTDIDFDQHDPARRRATRVHVQTAQGPQAIALAEGDACLVTLGSITADATYGSNTRPPELIRDRRDGAWSLWETLARKADDFGRPHTFFNVDDNKWLSFTLTMRGRALLDRLVAFSGNAPGTGALMTLVDSALSLIHISEPTRPY